MTPCDWPTRAPDSMRVDEVGDVARPFTVEEVDGPLRDVALAVAARRIPSLVMLSPILASLQRGARPRRGVFAARTVGALARAVVAILAFDVTKTETSIPELREAVRLLDSPALDALEDLFARFPAIRPIIEADRMRRAGLLEGEWELDVRRGSPTSRVRLTVVARPRPAEAFA
jgi:hypothetical protein